MYVIEVKRIYKFLKNSEITSFFPFNWLPKHMNVINNRYIGTSIFDNNVEELESCFNKYNTRVFATIELLSPNSVTFLEVSNLSHFVNL